MKLSNLLRFVLCTWTCLLISNLMATSSIWTTWTEYPADPIYDPYPSQTLPEDFVPYVVFSLKKFNGHGDAVNYKMWHQGLNANGSIAISNSNDGINWTLVGETSIIANAYHPVVLYDKNKFGGSGKFYRMWFWTGVAGTTINVIQFTQSDDGITWDAPVSITQNFLSPLVDGIPPSYFYHLYGPGFVIYNPNATNIGANPYDYSYVMFYDTASEGFGPGTSVEQIALAFSTDGQFWTRYGTVPVLIPSGNATDWDGSHAFRPSVIKLHNVYHMYYSGSNDLIDPLTSVAYAHGIGHASSLDGINWQRDQGNPIFLYTNEVPWRNTRSYTPFVLSSGYCGTRMWFTGGTGLFAGQDQGIGYATLECP